jgi:hypothetical protein
MNCTMFTSEAVLRITEDFVIIQKLCEPVAHNFFENFRKVTQQ